MPEHPLASSFLSARLELIAGDPSQFIGLLADDIEWWDTGASRPIRGKAAVADHLAQPPDNRDLSEVHDVLVNEEHLIALIHGRVSRDDSSFDYSIAEIYHFNQFGRLSKRQAFAPDGRAIDEQLG